MSGVSGSQPASCVIFGGTGYIGRKMAERFAATGRFGETVLADVVEPDYELPAGARFVRCDVRQPVNAGEIAADPAWIFNLAAVHREPGHSYNEYFDTNLPGARHVCAYAEQTNCPNMLFTSSIAVYGPTMTATREDSPKYPSTAYGISKLASELIHEAWLQRSPQRRLLVCRPGVVYGPGDPGNIKRMIDAVLKGLFFFPGNPDIQKSYAYVGGLLDSMDFLMDRDERFVTFNYVESPTEPLAALARHVREVFGVKSRTIGLPLWMLVPASRVFQLISGGNSGIHPVRVRKAATPTHIVPQVLLDMGFPFDRTFASTLEEWRRDYPDEFSS